MIVHVVQQGEPEWHALRLGKPTASAFHRILTPKTGKFAEGARTYAIELVTETMTRLPVHDLGNIKAVERGKELEPDAVQMYEFEQNVRTSPVGFITDDKGLVGASPDRLVDGMAAAIELKCPLAHTHMGYLLDGFGTDYKVQVQGQMLVGDLEWVDRYSYFPTLPPVLERTHRDEAFIAKLRAALDQFLALRDELLELAISRGVIPAPEPEPIAPRAAGTRRGNYFSIPPLEELEDGGKIMAG